MMATASIFLASKSTEQVIRIKDVALAFLNLQKSKSANQIIANKPITDEAVEKTMKNIIFHEFHLLAIIDYNFLAPLPYAEILKILARNFPSIMLRVSNNFANDSFRSKACIRFSKEEIANACVYLAAEFLGLEVDIQPDFQVINEIICVYDRFLN